MNNFNEAFIAQGKLIFLWFDVNPVTLPQDTALLYTIRFELLTADGNTAPVNFTDDPLERLVFNGSGTNVTSDVDYINGFATEAGYGSNPNPTSWFDCPAGVTELVQAIEPATTSSGSRVCLEVRSCNFNELNGFQYSINFDPTVLTYDAVENFELTQLSEGNFGTTMANMGTVVVAWNFDSTFTELTLPDNSLLYEICFLASGSAGDTSTVEIVGTPLEINHSDDNGDIGSFTTIPGGVRINAGYCSGTFESFQ